MTSSEKIKKLRLLMNQSNVHAVVIPSNDPHNSEYVAEYWQARKWMTGFTGSAGIAAITSDRAILWADYRYHIQAEEQIQDTEIELFKMGGSDVPGVDKWLSDNLAWGETISMDGALLSIEAAEKYKKKFQEKGLKLETRIDLVSQIWSDRPSMPGSKAYLFSDQYAGQARADKIEQVKAKMKTLGADYHLVVSLDDIAWVLNLRGSDVHTNPVNISFLIVGPDFSTLFIREKKIDSSVRDALENDGVKIDEYSNILDALEQIPQNKKVLLDPETTSVQLAQAINKECGIIKTTSPCAALKAVKNEIQVSHMRDTAVKDGVVLVNFLYWLENQKSSPLLTEISVAEKLYSLRKEQAGFRDNSFDPIMAFKEHSAMCHYSATKDTDVIIGEQGMFLSDSGGNYLTGTTDVTRTIFRGKPGKQEIQDYTLVLKGHIALASGIFPKGTRGVQLDILARQYLWNRGLDFGHGTGHGVGFFLCVHEGPARISPQPVDVALTPGMLLTNEPGIYREGQYGIRLENMVLVKEAFENEFGKFFEFEQMTYCHFERDLIDPGLLNENEKDWLNAYHVRVYEELEPQLDKTTASWLKTKTEVL